MSSSTSSQSNTTHEGKINFLLASEISNSARNKQAQFNENLTDLKKGKKKKKSANVVINKKTNKQKTSRRPVEGS